MNSISQVVAEKLQQPIKGTSGLSDLHAWLEARKVKSTSELNMNRKISKKGAK